MQWCTIVAKSDLHRQLVNLFASKLNLTVPSIDMDLIGSGLLDSLKLIDLLMELEQEWRVKISLDDLEVDHFRSISSIAAFLMSKGCDSGELPLQHVS
jgi:acyl carrier protein